MRLLTLFMDLVSHDKIAQNLCFFASVMRRDPIFYALFQRSPSLLFELIDTPPDLASQYRFESVAVKEPKAEVQFQKDEKLYERLFGKSFLYFYRNRDYFSDWQAVVIYPSRRVEQTDSHPYRALLSSTQVHRVYLDELGSITQLPLGVALMVLTTLSEATTPEAARMLLTRAERESFSAAVRQGIIDMIGTIMVYKFTNLSRQEIDAMLGVKIEATRVYREAQEEKAIAIALNMLQKDMPVETIAEVTGLPITQVQQLQTEPNQPSTYQS